MFGLFFLSVVLVKGLWQKVHPIVAINVFILLTSGIYTFYFPKYYPIPTNPILIARDGQEILTSMFLVTLFSVILMTQDKKFFEKVLYILFFSAVLDSIILLVGKFILNEPQPYAMLSNGTADACFIVCMIPFGLLAIKRNVNLNSLCVLIMIFAICISKSNTAIGGIGVGLAFILLQRMSLRRWSLLMVPLTIIFFLAARVILKDHFMHDSGRRFVWEGTWTFFRQFGNIWIGLGTGTFTVWGDAWQRAHYMANTAGGAVAIWIWLHCEPLEILFENGIIGLTGSLLLYGFMLKRSFNSYVFPILCVFGFTCLTEMPLRLFVTQILGVSLLGVISGRASRN